MSVRQNLKDDTSYDASALALAVMLPVCAVSVFECAFHEIYAMGIAHSFWGPKVLTLGPYFSVPVVGGFAAYVGSSQGRVGKLASLVGFTLLAFCLYHFRGSFNWPGVFDLAGRTPLNMLLPLVLAFIGGGLLGILRPNKTLSRSTRILSIALIVLALAWTSIDAHRDIGLYSQFGYTRHIALISMTTLGVIAWLAARKDE